MRFKYPKQIMIGATIFKMIYDKKGNGGEFAYPWKNKTAFIRLGMNATKLRILEVFIHEVKEIINYEQGSRLEDTTVAANYHFHYEHKQHSDFCARLAGCLEQFIK